jgi:glutamate carboxypeptidase
VQASSSNADALTAALAWLAGRGPELGRLLGALVAQNSHSQNRQGVNQVVDLLEPELRRLSLTVERIPGNRFGDHLAFRGRAHGAAVFLIGHTDTVFRPGSFEGFQVDGDLGRGPGAFDMKGGLVVTLAALEALNQAGLLARIPMAGMWVSDEEVGSPESQPILRSRAAGSACALGFEAGRTGDRIVTQRKGVASVTAVGAGVAAHAGNAHEKGRNAIWALARYVDRVQALTDYPRGLTVNVGRFEGGTSKNTVPSGARCEIDLRFCTAEDGQRLLERVESMAWSAAVEGTLIEVTRGSIRPPMVRTPASEELAREYGACQVESGLSSGESPLVGGGSDASVTSAAGIPSIDGLGPRGSGQHTLDEQIELSSLVPKASALVRFLARRAGAAS